MNITNINYILQYFPKFELSYEKPIHNKVPNANVLLAIPKGKKYFAWFTSYNKDNVCFLLELNTYNKIVSIKTAITSFHDSLVLGTIVYGTMTTIKNNCYFCIEDIYFYKGNSICVLSLYIIRKYIRC